MTNSETQKTRLNYNGEPLKDNEVLVLMPYFEEDRINILPEMKKRLLSRSKKLVHSDRNIFPICITF